MRVLVFGAGAVGSVLGAHLAREDTDLELVGRPAHVEAIRTLGLRVDGLPGSPFRVHAESELAGGIEFDRVLLTVKAPDIEPAARAIGETLLHPVPLLALQNGLGIRTRVRRALGSSGWFYADRLVTRGVASIPATLVGPGHVRYAGEGEIVLGDSGISGGLNGFDRLLAAAGIRVRVVESIEREEWKKALVNAAVNPITADHGIENGRLAEDPFRGQALALLHEAREVAEAEGYPIAADEAEQELFRIVRATATNRSSMLQDVDAGRPTEIEAISGAILSLGERHGVRLLHTQRAVDRIRARASVAARHTEGRNASPSPITGA
ncbi:MAG: 2-dehydropantoate 2-reductase [Thermoplasmata archaeon]|nr:2-dehydropantoate 2-reductase [Thermoplasmata archaeon]